ncbi:signal peptidase II [Deinococcus roseus]|uniref:Lipoprotein signal peptidase n=1 Tax=Deinococcus roseus TaxID=392414 RepID=A0ABQ2D4A7_9DEIO|nr:signal peptidase II [Deinococcus roseus]GGJ45711.1 lipoprotein signal peptidase [Deinococcus roseus]
MPLALIVFAVLMGLDQWLKAWSVTHLQPYVLKPLIENVLSLTLVYNTGAAWGMLGGATKILAVLRIVVGLGILVYLWREKPRGITFWSLVLISAGAVGNAIDGIRAGKVVDMFYSHQLSWITQKIQHQDFPIFNIADSCVVVGTILLIASSLFTKKPEPKKQSTPEA